MRLHEFFGIDVPGHRERRRCSWRAFPEHVLGQPQRCRTVSRHFLGKVERRLLHMLIRYNALHDTCL